MSGLCLLLNLAVCSNIASGQASKDKSTCEQEKHDCAVKCVSPHANCPESEKVIETLNLLVKAYSKGDLKTYEEYLDSNCTTFDEGTKNLVVGKQACLNDLKNKFARYAPTGETPLVSMTIEEPYAKVNGNTAVVTFKAIRELGGKHPSKEIAEATDVFVKEGDKWKKLHFRGRWKKVS